MSLTEKTIDTIDDRYALPQFARPTLCVICSKFYQCIPLRFINLDEIPHKL